MTKNTKRAFILTFVTLAVVIAFNTLTSYFCGVGLNLVALATCFSLVLVIFLSDAETRKRTGDLLILTLAFLVLELPTWLIFEFGIYGAAEGILVYQHIITLLGMLAFAYVIFRLFCEHEGKKIKFIEVMLGNDKFERKPRKSKKEVDNGSLSEKPNTKEEAKEEAVEEAVEPSVEVEIEQPTET
ncbi:MAG: hypothetical protein MJ149_02765, partial [Clostridia bacterium]|nr:hypothetical protein [Clostridia bacterium]